jgi:hypothetical protein
MAMLGVTGKPPNAPPSSLESAGLAVMLFGPIVAAFPYAYLAARIAAPTARDCWPEIFAAENEAVFASMPAE